MNVEILKLSIVGGLFAVLTLVHFAVDWLTQSHGDAMKKSKDWVTRAKHCFIYTMPFYAVFYFINVPVSIAWICFLILFFSHFLEDTYIPVYLWAKYIRNPRHAVFGDLGMAVNNDIHKLTGIYDENGDLTVKSERTIKNIHDFAGWMATPLGAILGITVDQIIHLAFLLLVSFIIVYN
jgi:hypothetical protein